MKTRHLVTCLFTASILSAFAANAEPIEPAAEGWINEGPNSKGRWSIEVPDRLGIRNRGADDAWATYLAFKVPENVTSVGAATLQLGFTVPRGIRQTFFLYGVAGQDWEPETLTAATAPGWSHAARDVDEENAVFLSETTSVVGQSTLKLGEASSEFLDFLKSHAGQAVTLIIVANAGSASVHSTEGSAKAGPKLILE